MNTEINFGLNDPKWFDMKEAAGLLNVKDMGRIELLNFLISSGVLYEDHLPNQDYIDLGYFLYTVSEIINSSEKLLDCEFYTLVSPTGIEFIRNLLVKKEGHNEK